MHEGGDVAVTKAAIDPVWHLPGIAERFEVEEQQLRRTLFEQTGGMYPELVTRPDIQVFLPPIGGITLYMFGDPTRLGDRRYNAHLPRPRRVQRIRRVRLRHLHCRPYLIHGIEEAVAQAQAGGTGLIVYKPQGRPRASAR